MKILRCKIFRARFHALADVRSPFCLGIDPSAEILAQWGFADTPHGLAQFCEKLIAQMGKKLAVVKPQAAYFERFGSVGLKCLTELTRTLQTQETLVLLDAKRGDIGSTNAAYAQAVFEKKYGVGADAVTLNPFLGFDALKPFFDAAKKTGRHVFVVTASSNPEGFSIQNAEYDKKTVSRYLAEKIQARNMQDGDKAVCGAVIGATRADIDTEFLEPLRDTLILAPGIGQQGSDFSAFQKFPHKKNLIPTAARSVLLAADFAAELTAHCQAAHDMRHS